MAELIGSFAPIRIGETRYFEVRAAGVARVGIRCFVRPPEPAVYRECAECGEVYQLTSGERVSITPSGDTFLGRQGGIELYVEEPGEMANRYVILLVQDRDSGLQQQAVAM
jgi:hypothetical protein